jgi:hypothetical protein
MKTTDTQQLSALMERQLSALSALKMIAMQQAECLGADQVELLLSLIARKQPLIEEFLQVQAELKPFHDEDPEQRVWQNPNDRVRCQKLLESCNKLHQEIVRIESQALGELELNRNAIAAQLQDCRDATLASSAYLTDSILAEGSLDLTNS